MTELPSLVSPALLAKATEELDAMVSGLIPDGKTGAAILVLDMDGYEVGAAAKVGKHFMVEASLRQRWAVVKPTAVIRVSATW